MEIVKKSMHFLALRLGEMEGNRWCLVGRVGVNIWSTSQTYFLTLSMSLTLDFKSCTYSRKFSDTFFFLPKFPSKALVLVTVSHFLGGTSHFFPTIFPWELGWKPPSMETWRLPRPRPRPGTALHWLLWYLHVKVLGASWRCGGTRGRDVHVT